MQVNIGSSMAHTAHLHLALTCGRTPKAETLQSESCLHSPIESLVSCIAPVIQVGAHAPPATPLNLSNAASLDLLSTEEQSLCSSLRVLPKPYLTIKEMYIRENERRKGLLKRRDARCVAFIPGVTNY